MIRVVLDASVLLSATVGRRDSPPSLLLDAVRTGQIEAAVCEQLLIEVRDGLASRYFRDRVSADERTAFLEMLRALATIAPDPVDPPPVLRDRADDYLVALATAAGAKAIVSGDRDLLDHGAQRQTSLRTVRRDELSSSRAARCRRCGRRDRVREPAARLNGLRERREMVVEVGLDDFVEQGSLAHAATTKPSRPTRAISVRTTARGSSAIPCT